MIRGTTPLLEFVLPFDSSILVEAYITFSQDNKVVFEKTLIDCQTNGNILFLKLSQTDTLKLSSGKMTNIQIRSKTTDGNVMASNIISEHTEHILKDGVI